MTVQPGANLYSQGFGSYPENVEIPVISKTDPNSSNVSFPIGKRWINTVANTNWVLTSVNAFNGTLTPTWVPSGGTTTDVSTISADTGTAAPVGGDIEILGTPSRIVTAASGNTVTLDLSPTLSVLGLEVQSDFTTDGNVNINVGVGNANPINIGNSAANIDIEGSLSLNTFGGNANNINIGSPVGTGVFLINTPSNGFTIDSISGNIRIGISTPSQITIGSGLGNSRTLIRAGNGGLILQGNPQYSVFATAGNYSVLGTDCIISVSTAGGPVTITLPASPSIGSTYFVLDNSGDFGANQCNVDGNGNNLLVEGAAPVGVLILNTNFAFRQITFNGGRWNVK